MLNFQNYPKCVFFFSIGLFVIGLLYVFFLYFGWNKPLNGDDALSVEVSLPIIDWQGYSTLSKQYEGDTISK